MRNVFRISTFCSLILLFFLINASNLLSENAKAGVKELRKPLINTVKPAEIKKETTKISPMEVKTEENQAAEFIKSVNDRIEKIFIKYNIAYWEATTTGKPEKYKEYEVYQLEYNNFFANKDEFSTIKKYKGSSNIKDPLLKRQIDLLYSYYRDKQVDKSLLEEMVKTSTAIEEKFNKYRGNVDGKELSTNDINKILVESKDLDLRKKAWEASKAIGEIVYPDLIKLVKIRNKIAKSLGFKNYHSMQLELNEQSEAQITAIFDELKRLTDQPFKVIKNEIDEALAKRWGITKEQMRPWHYQDPFFQEPPDIYEINFDELLKKIDIKELSEKFYNGIGLPPASILKNSDLYEKKDKYPHAYCTSIDRKKDVRILCNLKNDSYWMDTILHELGHAVYEYNIDQTLPFVLREEAHIFTTEAIAMFFGRMTRNAKWLESLGIINSEQAKKFEPIIKKSLKVGQLVFSRWAQVMYRFEKELYNNPDQDLNKLWWNLVKEYQYVTPPENRDKPDFGAKIHLISSPVYYHNYLLGELLASQLTYYITNNVLKQKDITKADYVNNKQLGEYLSKNIFIYAKSKPWFELIKMATGEQLTAKYFVKQFIEN